jgi:tetratricopeptide (TPR) repeat protein
VSERRRPVCVALVVAALLPTGAWADEEEESTAGRLSIGVFLLPEDKLPSEGLAIVTRGLEKGLKPNKKIAQKETDLLLAEFSGEVPLEALGEARAAAEAGKELLSRGQAEAAAKKLGAAEATMEQVLAFARKSELADLQFLAGVAYLQMGDKLAAEDEFARLQTWRPSYVVDVEKYPKVLPLWEHVRGQIDGAGRGSIEIKSEPAGAMAFVDGRYLGVTPTHADALSVGEHYVTVKKEGYQRRLVKVAVDPKVEQQVKEKLPRSEKYLLLSQSLDGAKKGLGDKKANQSMQDLRTFLFIDQAVFVRAKKGKGGGMVLDAWLYDLRSKRRLSQVKSVAVSSDEDKAEAALGELATALYAGVRYDGKTDEDDKLARRARGEGKNKGGGGITSKWWFWTAIGITAGVAVPVVLYEAGAFDAGSGPTCPDGDICGTVLIRY